MFYKYSKIYYGSYQFLNFINYITGALACCNGDTWASEIGVACGKADPVLITNWQKVPRGNFFLHS